MQYTYIYILFWKDAPRRASDYDTTDKENYPVSEGRMRSDTGSGSNKVSSSTSKSALTRENMEAREKKRTQHRKHQWVKMNHNDVLILKRNILSSVQQCEEASNKTIVEVRQ